MRKKEKQEIEKIIQILEAKPYTAYTLYGDILHEWEQAECYGIIGNVALIVYNIDGTNNKKSGFVKWLGGVR